MVESFADGHALIPFKHSNGFIRYSCPNCQDDGELGFLSPEEQDKKNLASREYALMYGLQKAMLEKLIEQDTAKVDAIIRIMNHIRDFYGNDSNNNSKYDFRTESGKFKSNYNYSYDSYDFYIELNVDDRMDDYIGSEILSLFSTVPIPIYSSLCTGLSLFSDYVDGEEISMIDALFLVISLGGDACTLISNGVSTLTSVQKGVLDNTSNICSSLCASWGMKNVMTSDSDNYSNRYSVEIKFTDENITKSFFSQYRWNSFDYIHIKQERLDESTGLSHATANYNKFTYNNLSSNDAYWRSIITGNVVENGIS